MLCVVALSSEKWVWSSCSQKLLRNIVLTKNYFAGCLSNKPELWSPAYQSSTCGNHIIEQGGLQLHTRARAHTHTRTHAATHARSNTRTTHTHTYSHIYKAV